MSIKQYKANQGDKYYYLFIKSFPNNYFDWEITLKAGEVFSRGQAVRQKVQESRLRDWRFKSPPTEKTIFHWPPGGKGMVGCNKYQGCLHFVWWSCHPTKVKWKKKSRIKKLVKLVIRSVPRYRPHCNILGRKRNGRTKVILKSCIGYLFICYYKISS